MLTARPTMIHQHRATMLVGRRSRWAAFLLALIGQAGVACSAATETEPLPPVPTGTTDANDAPTPEASGSPPRGEAAEAATPSTPPSRGDDAGRPVVDGSRALDASASAKEGGLRSDAAVVDGGALLGDAAASAADGGGVPYKGVANAACADLRRLNASWWYNWTLSPGSCATGEFVPMVSGKNEKTPTAVSNALAQVSRAGYRAVLAFNEPNKVDQANLTVAQVLALWPDLVSNVAVRVSTPATSADAQAWFVEFMTQVSAQKLRADFVAIHWYGWNAGSCDANAATLESYVKWAEGASGALPIWITEWGCMNQSNPDAATVQAFFTGALAMFKRHPRIERHAWYPWLPNNELVSANGELTPLGTAFAQAPAYR